MNPILSIGPLNVTPFGLIVFAGALCGVLLALRKKENGPVLPFVILGALLIGHMWWAFFCPPGYTAEAGTAALMLRIWDGGYTLYGITTEALGIPQDAWNVNGIVDLKRTAINDAMQLIAGG